MDDDNQAIGQSLTGTLFTLGDFRALTKHLHDNALMYPEWNPGFVPADKDPRVRLDGFAVKYGVAVWLSLIPLDEDEVGDVLDGEE